MKLRDVPIAVWVLVALVVFMLALAAYGYFSGAWEHVEAA